MKKKPKLSRVIMITILVLGSLICLFPFYWLVRTSLMDLKEIYQQPPLMWSEKNHWENFGQVFSDDFPFLHYTKNTLIIMIPVVIGTVLTSSMAAFAFARLRFRYKKFWFTLVLATMMLPGAVTMIPSFMLWNKIGLVDTYWPLIIPAFFGGGAFNIFLLRQFILGIPNEIVEASVIDGAGFFQIYCRIILPLIKPAAIVVIINTVLGTWNDFMGPLIYLYTPEKYTLSLAMQQFSSSSASNLGVIMAAALTMTVPAILLFFFFQKYFINSMVTSGLKG